MTLLSSTLGLEFRPMRIALKSVTGKVKARVARLRAIQGQMDDVVDNL
jgi:hypothetical protein